MTRRMLILGPLWLALACSDPVIEDARDELGGEQPGVPEGPLHRPGQPCLLCHDEGGPGDLVMSFGGTVYKFENGTDPLSGAYVDFLDSTGATYTTATNCSGNFYVQPADFDPTFPIWVNLRYGGIEIEMSSAIFREGSCGACHEPGKSPTSAGRVYFAPESDVPPPFPEDGCP